MKILKSQRGFTLIELVLIIVILGILAAVAIVQFGTLSISARDSAIDGAFGSYQSALAIGVGLCRGYPLLANGVDADGCDPTADDFDGDFCDTVYPQVTLTTGLTATACDDAADPVTFDIESGTAPNGRTATANYTIAGGVGILTLTAKADL